MSELTAREAIDLIKNLRKQGNPNIQLKQILGDIGKDKKHVYLNLKSSIVNEFKEQSLEATDTERNWPYFMFFNFRQKDIEGNLPEIDIDDIKLYHITVPKDIIQRYNQLTTIKFNKILSK